MLISRLMIIRYIFRCNGRFGSVLASFGGHIVELFPHCEKASGKLFPIGSVISNQKSLVTLSNNESSDFHDPTTSRSVLFLLMINIVNIKCGLEYDEVG